MSLNITVVNTIWGHSEGDHVFMPVSLDGVWHEGEPRSPLLENYSAGPGEHYFSPLRFNGTRKRGLVGKPGVIFADFDRPVDEFPLPPSVIIKSSYHNGHVYWFLDKPADPLEWERHARGWTHMIGADPGGWDLTQVLRVPGTLNGKYDPPQLVRVQLFKPDRIYKLEQFPQSDVLRSVSGDDPLPDEEKRNSYLYRALQINNLPLSAHYWLTVKDDELKNLGRIDRSKILWGLYKQLHEAGFTQDEIYQLCYFSAVNKFRDHPGRLWQEIKKATI